MSCSRLAKPPRNFSKKKKRKAQLAELKLIWNPWNSNSKRRNPLEVLKMLEIDSRCTCHIQHSRLPAIRLDVNLITKTNRFSLKTSAPFLHRHRIVLSLVRCIADSPICVMSVEHPTYITLNSLAAGALIAEHKYSIHKVDAIEWQNKRTKNWKFMKQTLLWPRAADDKTCAFRRFLSVMRYDVSKWVPAQCPTVPLESVQFTFVK